MNGASVSQDVLRKTMPLLHAGFIVTGIFTVLLGPVLPLLAQRWSLSDSQTAVFFAAQFGGLLIGVAVSSYLLQQTYRPAFISGFLLMGLGAATLGRGPWQTALLSFFCMGLGNGFITAATNLWVGEAVPERKARALSFVNFSWTIGAVSCPFLFKFFASPRAFLQVLVLICGVTTAVAIAFAASDVDSLSQHSARARTASETARIQFDSSAAIFSLLFFLYVGAETAVGGWLATYSRRVTGAAGTAWILAPAFFWMGMMVGRGLGTLALRRIPERLVVQSGSLLGFGGIAFLTQTKGVGSIYAAAFVTGLGFSVIFPILFAWMASHYGADARIMSGRMLAIGELGAAGIPWVVGVISAVVGSLRFGLSLLLADLGAVFLLATIIHLPQDIDGMRRAPAVELETPR
ncbi:MAG TPA: MFS transporter [Verrucomicrobiae bacterium]|nr:MFS transporter [Verrucomicrobiae bacterium]